MYALLRSSSSVAQLTIDLLISFFLNTILSDATFSLASILLSSAASAENQERKLLQVQQVFYAHQVCIERGQGGSAHQRCQALRPQLQELQEREI